MRASFAAVTMVGLVLAGCGTRLPLLSAKPAAMPTRASCPAMKDDAWKPAVDAAVHKVFDRELQKRFGDTAIQQRVAWGKTDRGDTVITALRIGPAGYALPDNGRGGAVEVVFKACAGEVVKIRKIAGLERKPKALGATR